MKVLVATYPYVGHFNPTQPVVSELVRRGHEVVWMTGPAYADKVRQTGARFVAMSTDALIDDQHILTLIQGRVTLAKVAAYLRQLFLDRIPAQLQDYQRVVDGDDALGLPSAPFSPDILLVEFCTYAARIWLDQTGQPYATLGINPLVTLDPEIPPWGFGGPPPTTWLGRQTNRLRHGMGVVFFVSRLSRALERQRQAAGLPPRPRWRYATWSSFASDVRSPDLHLLMSTPALEFPRRNLPPSIRFVGPLLPDIQGDTSADDGGRPAWWEDMLTHPRDRVVLVTQGTVAVDPDLLVRPTVEGLAAQKDLFLVVTGPRLEPWGPAVQTAAFIPHRQILPHVGVMVTNGGNNGVMAALSFGVPLVCAGRSEDKADVSSRVAWSGAGIDLRTSHPTAAAVRDAVLRILSPDDDRYRAAARRLQDDFATHNGPAEAADELEALARWK